jgi:hypothetical protein
MAVYVDNINIAWRGAKWCHLLADSLDELHAFALALDVPDRWFHKNASYPHYDIKIEMRAMALTLGACIGNRRIIISCARRLKIEMEAIEGTQKVTKNFDAQTDLFENNNAGSQIEQLRKVLLITVSTAP